MLSLGRDCFFQIPSISLFIFFYCLILYTTSYWQLSKANNPRKRPTFEGV